MKSPRRGIASQASKTTRKFKRLWVIRTEAPRSTAQDRSHKRRSLHHRGIQDSTLEPAGAQKPLTLKHGRRELLAQLPVRGNYPGPAQRLPVVKDTRVAADAIVECAERGEAAEEIARDYRIKVADVKQLLAYAAKRIYSALVAWRVLLDHNVSSHLVPFLHSCKVEFSRTHGLGAPLQRKAASGRRGGRFRRLAD